MWHTGSMKWHLCPGYVAAALCVALFGCDDQPLRPNEIDPVPTGPAPEHPHVCDVVERVFTPKCAGCHGEGGVFPALTENGARELLDAKSKLYDEAPLIVVGDLEGSLLYRKVSGTQTDTEGASMPMGAPLEEASRELIATWIETGASMDCNASAPPAGGDPSADPADAGTPMTSADAGAGAPQAQYTTICDVDARLFAPKCVACHGTGGQAPELTATGMLSSLVDVPGAGDVVRVVPGDASASLLYQKMDGTAAGARMPLGGMATSAEMELVRTWIEQGATLDCSAAVDGGPMSGDGAGGGPPPPPVTPVCSSERYWTDGDDGSPRMHPGRACISCHQAADDDDTPDLWVGGTVFPSLHEPDDCRGADGTGAYAGAKVRIEDANGLVHWLDVNASGNFMLHRSAAPSFTMPFRAEVHYDNRVRQMHGAKSSGDCNSCHTVYGDNYAPGRIYLP